jgi:hypothetical protein
LAYRRERRGREAGLVDVVEPGNRDLARDVDTARLERLDRPEGHRVVRRDEGVEALPPLVAKETNGFHPRRLGEVPDGDDLRIEGEPGGLEDLPVRPVAILRLRVVDGPADERHPPLLVRHDHVLDELLHARGVVDQDRRTPGNHDGEGADRNALEALAVPREGLSADDVGDVREDDRAVDVARRDEVVEPVALGGGRVVRLQGAATKED